MAAKGVSKWSVLIVIQMRLDSRKVHRYEAILAHAALSSLFVCTDDNHLPNILDMWVNGVQNGLQCIIDGDKYPETSPEMWSSIWAALRKPTDRVVAKDEIAELFEAATHPGET